MEGDAPSARLFLEQSLAEPELVAAPAGQVAVFSAPAPGKDGPNEDGAAVVGLSDGLGVLLVADGVGGGPAGESAAALTLLSVAAAVTTGVRDEPSLRGAILDGIEGANRKVMELGIGAGTTVAAVELAGDTVRPYHVGDSAIVVVGQRGRLKLQTVAHSPVGYAVESGMLDEEEALHHDDRHLVSNLVGSSDMRIEVGSPLRLASRDTLLLASDGLLDNLTLPEIVETIRKGPLADAARALCQTCFQRMLEPASGRPSKPDDLTVLLYRRSPTAFSPGSESSVATTGR